MAAPLAAKRGVGEGGVIAVDRCRPPPRPAAPLRRRLRRDVQALFNDAAQGERPIARSDEAGFAPGSVIGRVHGAVVAMLVGGMGRGD